MEKLGMLPATTGLQNIGYKPVLVVWFKFCAVVL